VIQFLQRDAGRSPNEPPGRAVRAVGRTANSGVDLARSTQLLDIRIGRQHNIGFCSFKEAERPNDCRYGEATRPNWPRMGRVRLILVNRIPRKSV